MDGGLGEGRLIRRGGRARTADRVISGGVMKSQRHTMYGLWLTMADGSKLSRSARSLLPSQLEKRSERRRR